MARQVSPRSYVGVLLCITLLGAGGMAAVNALIDPLWFFTHAHPLNRVQPGFDERAQKTNWLQARRGQFDAVLFGSSRSTYIDQRDFTPLRMFNYSVNAMWPREYKAYLDHFSAVNGRAPEVVVLGVDFFGSQLNLAGKWRPPETYLQQAGDRRYLARSLLSLDLFERSLRTGANSLGLTTSVDERDHYDRDNVRHFSRSIHPDLRAREILGDLEYFQAEFYVNYNYNEDLPRIWASLRDSYPRTRFIVFTTPVAEPMFALEAREGKLENYQRWLADLTATFGQVWDFMGLNSVTTDLSNYRDAQHFHPRIGRLIVDRLMLRAVVAEHGDFGRLVTPDGLAEHMAFLRGQMDCLDPDPIGTARARLEVASEADAHDVPQRTGASAKGACQYADNSGRTS